MAWFRRQKDRKQIIAEQKEELWVRCKACKAHIYKEEWHKNLRVCPKCNYHGRLTCYERLQLLIDEGTFSELDADIVPLDSLGFVDGKGSYGEKILTTIKDTGMNESVITGSGSIHSIPVSIAIMDFRFFGGSLSSGCGEKILRGANYAFENDLPYVIVSASGGARMQEGMLSLMQMAKTCAGIARLREKRLPYISVLTDPTTGGVLASFAMMGDINIAEPGATIAFAGRRVIEQTIRQKLPDNFQTSEYLLEHGFIDSIVQRKDLKHLLHQLLVYQRN